MAKVFKRRFKKIVDGKTVVKKTSKYYGLVKDSNGKWQRVPLTTDKTASGQLLAALVKKASQREGGMNDPFEEGKQKPLLDHLKEYVEVLAQKSPSHAKDQSVKLRKVFKAIKAVFFKDITKKAAYRVQSFFKAKKLCNRTVNRYTTALKAFCNHLHENEVVGVNPLAGKFRKLSEHEEHHGRRALSVEESAFLIWATHQAKADPRVKRSPEDRAMMYFLALRTGLRDKELCSLTKENFDLANNTLTIHAKNSKGKRTDILQLNEGLQTALPAWLASKPANTQLFAGKYHRGQSGKRFKIDMAYARKLYIENSTTPEERANRESDDFLRFQNSQGLFADFHAQRTTFVTQLLNSGVPVQQVQKLARHKSAITTLGHYAKTAGAAEMAAAVSRLPSLTISGAPSSVIDDKTLSCLVGPTVGLKLAEKSDIDCDFVGLGDTGRLLERATQIVIKTLKYSAFMLKNECAPDRNRTCNLRFRRPMLYPVELQVQIIQCNEYRTEIPGSQRNRPICACKAFKFHENSTLVCNDNDLVICTDWTDF